jgi:hypothetical protein
MNHNEQKQHVEDFLEKIRQMILKKGDDYSNQDRLSTFKLAGAITGLDARMICVNQIAIKVSRLGVLVGSGKSSEYESLRDSILDLASYAVLLDQILCDEDKVDSERFW